MGRPRKFDERQVVERCTPAQLRRGGRRLLAKATAELAWENDANAIIDGVTLTSGEA